MPLIDERGRIFGRFNLFDLAMAFVVLGLIPLGYGAYVLFRTPPPALASIDPAVVVLDKEMRFRIHGTNLRPYMRVSLDNNQTRQFLFKDAATAEIVFRTFPPANTTSSSTISRRSDRACRKPSPLRRPPFRLPRCMSPDSSPGSQNAFAPC
jgi:hypothetical protein